MAVSAKFKTAGSETVIAVTTFTHIVNEVRGVLFRIISYRLEIDEGLVQGLRVWQWMSETVCILETGGVTPKTRLSH